MVVAIQKDESIWLFRSTDMKLRKALLLNILAASLLWLAPLSGEADPSIEISHSGGTDHCGCHYNRSTGEYHCHTRKQRGGDCPP